jgi:hypothetical protein
MRARAACGAKAGIGGQRCVAAHAGATALHAAAADAVARAGRIRCAARRADDVARRRVRIRAMRGPATPAVMFVRSAMAAVLAAPIATVMAAIGVRGAMAVAVPAQ